MSGSDVSGACGRSGSDVSGACGRSGSDVSGACGRSGTDVPGTCGQPGTNIPGVCRQPGMHGLDVQMLERSGMQFNRKDSGQEIFMPEDSGIRGEGLEKSKVERQFPGFPPEMTMTPGAAKDWNGMVPDTVRAVKAVMAYMDIFFMAIPPMIT